MADDVVASKGRKTATGVAVVGLVVLAVWAHSRYGFGLDDLKAQHDALRAWVSAEPLAAAALFFAVYVAAAALALPVMAPLTLAGGALFGFVEAVLLVSFASTIGASAAFLLSRATLRSWLEKRHPERLRSFDEGVRRSGGHFLLTLRLIPVVPFFLINLLAGMTPLRLRTFYWVSQLGMLPGTLAYVYAGRQLGTLDSAADVLSPGLLGALLLLAALPWIARAALAIVQRRRAYAQFDRPLRYDYNVLVIGAGSAGLVSAYLAAAAGARVALVERERMGGDCLNTGCVPSKTLLRSARFMHEVRRHAHYGIAHADARMHFAQVMRRVRDAIDTIAPHDSVERYEGLGVDVVQGSARLVSPWSVDVDGRVLTARSLVIATGASPTVPSLDGLSNVPYLTSDTVWDLESLPPRLVVLGGGPIGCELGQAFARLGSQVTVVELAPQLMGREDEEAAAAVARSMQDDGVELRCGHRAIRVEARGDGGVLVCRAADADVEVPFDRLLVALGRTPRTEGLDLDALGITISDRGTVESDAWLRTSLPNITVAGDVAGPYQFTHTAAHQAWYAVANALLAPFWKFRADYRVIPRVTYTGPEVAQVGLTASEASRDGVAHEVTRFDLAGLDRAITEGEAHGFVKILTRLGSDRILGATIVGAHAGELLAPIALAMRHGLGLRKVLATVHAYPTHAEAVRATAGAWQRAHPPARLLSWARRYFEFRRR